MLSTNSLRADDRVGRLYASLQTAKPFSIPVSKYAIVLETGQALVWTPPAQMLRSFAQDRGNAILKRLLQDKKIGHLEKLKEYLRLFGHK